MHGARRRIALAVALVCLGVPAGANAAASPAQWRITDASASRETVSVLHGWTPYSLVNRVNSYASVRYKDRLTGPKLKFGGGHNTWKIRIKTSNPNVHDHRAVDPRAKVALYNTDSGNYLRWNENSFGWDAQLEQSPAYEWKIAKTSGDGDVRIYNTTAKAYMVFGTQHVGIDLRWSPSSDPFPDSDDDDDDGLSGTPHEASVTMTAQPPVSGYVAFQGQFGGGVDFNGVLERVTAPSSTYSLYFIKPGHSSGECGDAAAVETLGPGQTMTPAQMKSIWGDEKPLLDDGLTFLACASTNASSVFVNILWSSVDD